MPDPDRSNGFTFQWLHQTIETIGLEKVHQTMGAMDWRHRGKDVHCEWQHGRPYRDPARSMLLLVALLKTWLVSSADRAFPPHFYPADF
jgi:hypothetical protein